jgi:hypothetical protein
VTRSGLLFLSGAALYGAMLLLPLYWQQARGASALTAAVALASLLPGRLAPVAAPPAPTLAARR